MVFTQEERLQGHARPCAWQAPLSTGPQGPRAPGQLHTELLGPYRSDRHRGGGSSRGPAGGQGG